MRCRLMLASTVALAIATTCAVAQDRAELEVDHALTFEFETPHTNWAQPYARGTTRVLFFTDGRGTRPRECVEVMQRFDLEAQAVFWAQIVDSSETHWHGGDVGEQRMLELLGQEWDAYVFLGLDLSNMSAQQQYMLLKPVTEGAGIVFVGADDKRVLKEENRIAELPPFIARGPVGEAYRVGQGRGIRLPAQPSIAYDLGWEVEYDYWAECLGRAILWAAGHEPAVAVSVGVGPGAFAWDAPKTLTADFTGLVAGDNPRVELRVRKPGGPEIRLPDRPLHPRALAWQVGALPAGDYWADARLVSDLGVEAWTSALFTVVSDLSVAGVLLDAEWGEVGDVITGRAIVEGSPGPSDYLRMGLFDRRGRLLRQQIVPATAGETRFAFDIEPWLPMLVRVDAALFRNPPGPEPASVIDSGHAWCRVTKRHHGRFNFLMWDVPTGTLAPYAEQSLAETGVTVQLKGGAPPLMLSAFDIAWVPYTTRIMASKTEDGIMEPFCWNDREAVQAHVQAKAQEYLPARQHGVFVWSLGDEVTTRGSCLSPHCAEAYRAYLHRVYGDLDALNQSWGTDFTEWSQVGLSKEGDNDEANALAEGNYPRWFDRRAFQSYNFVQFCQAYDRAYSAIDPLAKTGFEGAGRFSAGDDLDLIIRENEFWSPYPGVADEVIRSIAPREFPRANWMGYSKDADSLLRAYWRMITRGCDSVWWWRWDCIGRFHGWLAPDLRPFPAVREILADTRIVREGLGDLLLQSEMHDDRIAVLYSYPATFACEIEDGPSYGSYESAHVAVHNILRDLGYQFRYVTDRMLRLGEFEAGRYRILLLPRIEALGAAEAQVVRDFVAGGGVVIADVRPAIYDGHCKPLAQGLLDEVFGITAHGRAAAAVGPATIAGEPSLSFAGAAVDPTVQLTTAQARGEASGVPIMITNRYGSGAAVLLNFAAGSFPKLEIEDTPAAAAALMLELISRSGQHPPALRMLNADGERLRNIELTRWQDGTTQIISLFRQSGNRERATVVLPVARHVYDLRNGRSLGRVDRFDTEIIPSRASFFALTDLRVPTPDLRLSPSPATRGTVVTASISVPGARGLHAFHITGQAGEAELDWLEQVVIAGVRPIEFPIPLAINDRAGQYRIVATELFSGSETVATLNVN
ncbi:MAG: beta-galactosidase [Armatimonadota bacterium]